MAATGDKAIILSLLLDTLNNHQFNPVLPVAQPNVKFPENEGESTPDNYLAADIWFNPTRQVTLSGRAQQLRGLFQVTVYWARNTGLIQPLNVAEQVVQLFREQILFAANDLKLVVSSEPWVASPMTDGPRVSIPVTIPWYAFEPEV
jgi:hypothetical protein